jgi:hypothetical protein
LETAAHSGRFQFQPAGCTVEDGTILAVMDSAYQHVENILQNPATLLPPAAS